MTLLWLQGAGSGARREVPALPGWQPAPQPCSPTCGLPCDRGLHLLVLPEGSCPGWCLPGSCASDVHTCGFAPPPPRRDAWLCSRSLPSSRPALAAATAELCPCTSPMHSPSLKPQIGLLQVCEENSAKRRLGSCVSPRTEQKERLNGEN